MQTGFSTRQVWFGGTGPVVNVQNWSRVQLQLHSSFVARTNLRNCNYQKSNVFLLSSSDFTSWPGRGTGSSSCLPWEPWKCLPRGLNLNPSWPGTRHILCSTLPFSSPAFCRIWECTDCSRASCCSEPRSERPRQNLPGSGPAFSKHISIGWTKQICFVQILMFGTLACLYL